MTDAPCGSWKSPITSDLIVSSTVGLGAVQVDGGDVYWLEGRPREGGRQVLVRQSSDGKASDVTPPPFNVRTRVHEYGGGAYTVSNGMVIFANFSDQRLYTLEPGGEPNPLTHLDGMRYADLGADRTRRLLFCVREDHTGGGEAVNTIVTINLDTGEESVVVAGNDFYSSPRLSPGGRRLCWLTWNHPNMPWDATELWVANVDDGGGLSDTRLAAGEDRESIFQPEWAPDGTLFFVSDRSGWWNLYHAAAGKVEPVLEMEAEFGAPQWTFDARTYALLPEGQILAAYSQNGTTHLALIDPTRHDLTPLDVPLTSFGSLRVNANDGTRGRSPTAPFIASSPTTPAAVYELDLVTKDLTPLAWSTDLRIDEGYISLPEPVEFLTESGLISHALFYSPKNKDFSVPAGEKPPLIVMSHGGPTGATGGALSLARQYWTSRGFAVLDVNYGGSTGYGRAYRERLNGSWGIVDVDDCANGALYLVKQGRVDGDRLAITGGSAGGYTTLAALTFRDVFKAGASHYGIGDLEALARDTHKFESRYLDGLVGPYPEGRDLYLERSPIHHVERLSRPVIFFQGLEDQIVPPNQAEAMVEALRHKGIPVAYLAFEGEQHGFRKAENIRRSLDAELYFYGRIFGFEPADDIEPVAIENL